MARQHQDRAFHPALAHAAAKLAAIRIGETHGEDHQIVKACLGLFHALGAVAGLVAITPASGYGAPMTSIVLGLIVSPLCFYFVSTVKNKFKYDEIQRLRAKGLRARSK